MLEQVSQHKGHFQMYNDCLLFYCLLFYVHIFYGVCMCFIVIFAYIIIILELSLFVALLDAYIT